MTHTDGMQSNTPGINTEIYQRIIEQEQLELKTCEYSDHNLPDLEHDIDPDNNFFSNINNDNTNTKTTKGKLSIIHFNSRRMYANVNNIKEYLNKFTQPFNKLPYLKHGHGQKDRLRTKWL